jgi:DNA-binding PadR family transcriptional regulator
MQNKAKFRKVKLNVTKVLTTDYVQMDTWSIRKNEPKTNPNEPKTNPILAQKTTQQTQTNPKQTQFKPNQIQFQPLFSGLPKIIRIKGNFYLTYIHRAAMYRLLIFYFGDTKLAISKDLIAASASPLVLSILSQGENYGYAIIKHVRELSGGKMQWTDGMLYPVLHRLEKQGLIKSDERISETRRKRRYYQLENKGTTVLKEQRNQWMLVYSTLKQLWKDEPCLT